MHDAFDRAMSIVADRIEQFFGPMLEFIRRGNELARDRVMRIVAIDQVRQSWRQRDRVARRHRVQRGALFGRRKSVLAKLRRRAKRRHGLSFFIHGSATGVHITCSMRCGARRQHHQPVEAERDAGSLRHRRQRGQKILVHRIALAMDALLLGHRRLEPARCSATSVSSPKALASSTPQA